MKAKKINFKSTGSIALTETLNGGVMKIHAWSPGNVHYEAELAIDDWHVAQMAKEIRTYMIAKEQRFVEAQKRLREAMGYATSQPTVDYSVPKS